MFDDSTTFLRIVGDEFQIYNNNGEKWSNVKGIPEDVSEFKIDPNFPKYRAFAYVSNKDYFYMTVDLGKTWTKHKYMIPKELYNTDHEPYCTVSTHATNPKDMFLECQVCWESTDEEIEKDRKKYEENRKTEDDDPLQENSGPSLNLLFNPKESCETVILTSSDGGEHFLYAAPPYKVRGDEKIITSKLGSVCKYARINNDSTVDVEETTLVCIYRTYQLCTRSVGHRRADGQLYIIKDGKSRAVDFFKDITVESFEVAKSHLIVSIKEDIFNILSNEKIWISKDIQTFKQSYIPTDLTFNYKKELYEDSLGRMIMSISNLTFKIGEKFYEGKKYQSIDEILEYKRVLVSDYTGLKFSVYDQNDRFRSYEDTVEPIKYLKGTIIKGLHESSRFLDVRDNDEEEKSSLDSPKISFDNGNTWDHLKIIDPENRDKYSCNIDDPENCSIISLSPYNSYDIPSAGILVLSGIMSNENIDFYKNGKTFLSRDGGKSWKMVLDFPTQAVVGDNGNIIVAIRLPEEEQSIFYYSLDQGETWNKYRFKEISYFENLITTTRDGSGAHFILQATPEDYESYDDSLYSIDFSKAFGGKKCGKDDFETFYLNDGNCINGAKYSYRRRKLDAECLVKEALTDLELKEEICPECTDMDYECSFEFTKNVEGNCVPDFNLLEFSGACSKNTRKELTLMPRRKIIGNKCKNELTIDPVHVSCSTLSDPINSSDNTPLKQNPFSEKPHIYEYFNTGEDEYY